MKRYILFDNDGVLVETEPWYYEANVRALGALGVSFSREQCLTLMADGFPAGRLPGNRTFQNPTL